ncbi:MAG: phosphonate ABC transporter, permease protein PhnE [Actinomycetota bacterium]
MRTALKGLILLGIFAVFAELAEVEPTRLWDGLPRMAGWARKALPPDTGELGILSLRAAETVAMAAIGTLLATILALGTCFLAARNVSPNRFLALGARWVHNLFRGMDSFVFALLFVAAVGLGPFAGVLGVGLHTWGSMGKLYSEAIETADSGPLDAARLTGAGRIKVIRYALVPDILPSMASVTLYFWEFNVRASTVLGVVGAGGIGQELKNSMDLLNFPRLLTIIGMILVMVTAIDQLSALLRRRLT